MHTMTDNETDNKFIYQLICVRNIVYRNHIMHVTPIYSKRRKLLLSMLKFGVHPIQRFPLTKPNGIAHNKYFF